MEELVEKVKEQDKRDRLVAEWVLRIAVLEKLLLEKGLITREELAESYMDSLSKMNEFMKLVMAQKDDNNKKN